MSPDEVNERNAIQVWNRLYAKRLDRKSPAHFKLGDRVCLNKKHRPFKKGYLPGRTEEVFKVTGVRHKPLPTGSVNGTVHQ